MIKTGKPAPRLELMQPPWGREAAKIDAFAANPILDYLREVYGRPSMSDDPPPTMFLSGDFPPYLATGEDPAVLRWVAWRFRHSAASTPSRSRLYEIVEASAVENGFVGDELQTPEGAAAHSAYVGRMWEWAIRPKDPKGLEISGASGDAFFNGGLL